jgi:hypothetical protein
VLIAGTNIIQIHQTGASRSIESGVGNWEKVASVYNDPSSLMILRELHCGDFWYWGWDIPVANATVAGQALFENLVYAAIGSP